MEDHRKANWGDDPSDTLHVSGMHDHSARQQGQHGNPLNTTQRNTSPQPYMGRILLIRLVIRLGFLHLLLTAFTIHSD